MGGGGKGGQWTGSRNDALASSGGNRKVGMEWKSGVRVAATDASVLVLTARMSSQ